MNKKQLITGLLLTGLLAASTSMATHAQADTMFSKNDRNSQTFAPVSLLNHNSLDYDLHLQSKPSKNDIKDVKDVEEAARKLEAQAQAQAAIDAANALQAAHQAAISAQANIINNAQNGILTPGYNLIETRDFPDDSYPYGSCTWGAKAVAPWAGNNWGNAGQWASSAAAAGFKTGSTPMVGSIASWSGGHVAVVIGVQANGLIQVLESNYAGNPTIAVYRPYFNPNFVQGTVTYIYPPADYGI